VADEPIPLRTVQVRVVRPDEVPRFNALLHAHHYLGFRKFCGCRPRLFLIVNNSCFLLLPTSAGTPHLASRVLGLSLRHLPRDWLAHHGHPILLAEQFMAALHRFGKVDRDRYEEASIWRVSSTDQIESLSRCVSRPCHATGSKPQS